MAHLEFLISLNFGFHLHGFVSTPFKLEKFRACLVGFRVFCVGKARSQRNFAVAIVLM